jgi:flavorubredoxin
MTPHTSHTQIIKNIHRLSVAPNPHFEFNQFLIIDEKNCLVHTGKDAIFPTLKTMVSDVLAGAHLHYIIFSHYEADECGSINRWLEAYPQAQVVCNKVANISLEDFIIRPARILKDGECLKLGQRSLTLLNTPHFPHNWDAHLWYEANEKLLFSSDFCCQGGITPPAVGTDISQEMIEFYERGAFIPYGKSTNDALEKISKLPLHAIIPMHGSTVVGEACQTVFRKVKEDLVSKSLAVN